ncbi:MAG: T9SS type A sorting domain-containing protein [Chitinophagales bacterium]
MKKSVLLLTILLYSLMNMAHQTGSNSLNWRIWKVKNNKTETGSFLMLKANQVYIETGNGRVLHFPITELSAADAAFVNQKYTQIRILNANRIKGPFWGDQIGWNTLLLLATLMILLIAFTSIFAGKTNKPYFVYFSIVATLAVIFGFRKAGLREISSSTSPGFVDSAFAPFKPNVSTYFDNNYFYVESRGIPTTHQMMVGISDHGWQQQVPIPQCYFNPNVWPIPLNPVMAASPIPCDSIHFTRGAIAIAVNGVPIFNVHTNTGVDSYLDGQLDDFGGHCGRADDYHYHIAPLHLYGHTSSALPIAYGLDGFAVYGALEPDGTSMHALDANHGHFGNDGVYHYHGTANAPYMIARMAGEVTEDMTHQLVPQAAAHPIRPSRTPLTGALITSCVPNATNNGYTLSYTRSGQNYQVDYNWDEQGNYTFHYINPGGTLDSLYHGFVPCDIATGIKEVLRTEAMIQVYPTPVRGQLHVTLGNEISRNEIKQVLLVNSSGKTVFTSNSFTGTIDVSGFLKGIYLLELKMQGNTISKRVIVD